MAAHYSYSRLEVYEGCPLAYKFQYKDKRQQLPSEALEDGSETHDWLAAYNKYLLEKNLKTDLDWIRGANATPEVKEILDLYSETHILEPGNYVIEEMWRILLKGYNWWGMIDLLKDEQSHVLITDFKTDHRVRSQTEIDKDRQLRFYAWMASRKYPHADTFVCSIDFVRHGVTRSTTYTVDDIPAIEKEIIAAIERIEADEEFKARPGTRCAWCSWTEICPVLQQGELEVVTGPNDAARAAEQLVVLKARIKTLEDMLKPWCSKEGAIPVNGMQVGYRTSHSAKYDFNPLAELLGQYGYISIDYLQPNTTAIKKLAAKDKDLAADLEEIATDASKSKFELWKGDAA